MFSGRFRDRLDRQIEQSQRSFLFDWHLVAQKVATLRAHTSRHRRRLHTA
jgi:argininosuccinate lyase